MSLNKRLSLEKISVYIQNLQEEQFKGPTLKYYLGIFLNWELS